MLEKDVHVGMIVELRFKKKNRGPVTCNAMSGLPVERKQEMYEGAVGRVVRAPRGGMVFVDTLFAGQSVGRLVEVNVKDCVRVNWESHPACIKIRNFIQEARDIATDMHFTEITDALTVLDMRLKRSR